VVKTERIAIWVMIVISAVLLVMVFLHRLQIPLNTWIP
jgi:hypothetical protein